MKRVTEIFKEIVTITSISLQEKAVFQELEKRIKDTGFQIMRDRSHDHFKGECPNMIIRVEGKKKTGGIFFASHIDTVEPGRNIKARISDGYIESDKNTILGADDKAGVAAMLETIIRLKEGPKPPVPVEFLFTVAEEIGLLGAKHLDYALIKNRTGFVLDGEGGLGRLYVKAPSQDAIRGEFKGRSAHAGVCPEKGISAIVAASKAISSMKLGRIDKETTANIGVISGGQAMNIVPDNVYLEGEARSLNERKLKKQTKHMTDCLEEASRHTGTEVKYSVERLYNSYNLDKKERPVRIAKKALKAIGVTATYETTGGGSDTNIFNENGLISLNVGIGAEDVHTREEKIKIDELEKLADFCFEVIRVAGNEV